MIYIAHVHERFIAKNIDYDMFLNYFIHFEKACDFGDCTVKSLLNLKALLKYEFSASPQIFLNYLLELPDRTNFYHQKKFTGYVCLR